MSLLISFAVGIATGLLFYGGLWLTVRALASARFAPLIALPSFLVRAAIVLAGFLVTIDHDWRRALFWMAGFAAARWVAGAFVARAGGERCT